MYFWSVSLVYQLSGPFLIFFGVPNFFCLLNIFLVDQKNEKLTGQLVYQRDWPKVHGRRFNQLLLTFDFRAHQIEIHGTHNGDTSNHNSDGKTVKTTVVTYKNGSKTTTITEPIIDKHVSDISEDLQSGTNLTPDVTGKVVIFPKFPTWDNFGPGIKCQIILKCLFCVFKSTKKPTNFL